MYDFLTYNRNADWVACGQLENPLDEIMSMLTLTDEEFINLKKICSFPDEKGKKVLCVDTNTVFNSRLEAAQFVNVIPSAITQAIKRKNRCGGYRWENVY